MSKTSYQIPFDSKGNLESYPSTHTVWKENFEFDATLTFDGFYRGRSAAGTTFINKQTGLSYSMFLKDFDEVIRKGIFNGGLIIGRFTFQKRGKNYGIRMI